jgi:acetoacetyl-CoA synthetase
LKEKEAGPSVRYIAMEFETTPRKLWEHPDPKSTAMWAFMQDANAKYGLNMQVS